MTCIVRHLAPLHNMMCRNILIISCCGMYPELFCQESATVISDTVFPQTATHTVL